MKVELVFSSHTVNRMQQRKISPDDVENIIYDFDGQIKQSIDKTIYYKKMKGRLDNDIAVVAVKKKH